MSDEGLDAADQLSDHPLLKPVSAAQQLFIDTVFGPVIGAGNDWPVFDFVKRVLRPHGVDAMTELAAFPSAANSGNSSMAYRHIWADGGGYALSESSRVRLTIAGLRQESSGGGPGFADFLARVVGWLATLEVAIVPDPDTVATATFDLNEVLAEVDGSSTYQGYFSLIASVLEREVPIFGCAQASGSEDEKIWSVLLRNDLSAFVGVTDSEDYVRRVLVSIGADRPPAVTSIIDMPLSLIDEIGYLDAVWEARTGEAPMFGATRVASCAGLALSCSSPEEFDARMNALYDVLSRIKVPLDPDAEAALQGRHGSLQRLRTRLCRDLPIEDHARVDVSIGLLQDAVRIRAALHTGVQRELPSRYRSLGLAYPPTNYGAAWDHIRERAAGAIRSIRQAVETLP